MVEEKKIEEFKIPIEDLFPKFKEHLEIKDNSRILFSGKFGIGKTYFLKEFFKTSQEYEVFHFSPVNYQINSNEDIAEFLKYDILVELNKMVPDREYFTHAEGNSSAHIKTNIVGSSETIFIEDGALLLGTWQGIFFCEFDGPRTRSVWVKIIDK